MKTGTGPKQFKSAPNLFNAANLNIMGTKQTLSYVTLSLKF